MAHVISMIAQILSYAQYVKQYDTHWHLQNICVRELLEVMIFL